MRRLRIVFEFSVLYPFYIYQFLIFFFNDLVEITEFCAVVCVLLHLILSQIVSMAAYHSD